MNQMDTKKNRKNDIPEDILRKYDDLKILLKKIGSALVAFSGGVDSTFLVKVAQDVLGAQIPRCVS